MCGTFSRSVKVKARGGFYSVSYTHLQLQKYRAYIKSVRETVSDLLRRIDQQSQMASQKIEATVQEVPGRNMSLFERKNGTEQQL